MRRHHPGRRHHPAFHPHPDRPALGSGRAAAGLGRQRDGHGARPAVRARRAVPRAGRRPPPQSLGDSHRGPGAGPPALRRRTHAWLSGPHRQPDQVPPVQGRRRARIPVPLGGQGSHGGARAGVPEQHDGQAPARRRELVPSGGVAGGQRAAGGGRRAPRPPGVRRHARRPGPRRVPRRLQGNARHDRGASDRRGRDLRRRAAYHLTHQAVRADRQEPRTTGWTRARSSPPG